MKNVKRTFLLFVYQFTKPMIKRIAFYMSPKSQKYKLYTFSNNRFICNSCLPIYHLIRFLSIGNKFLKNSNKCKYN